MYKVYTRKLNRVLKYNIYAGLLVHTTLNLAYPKKYMYYMLLTYSMISSFQNLLCFFVIYNYVICDSFLNLVIEDHMIDAYNYIIWGYVIGLEGSKKF